jgi:hypothetical protein
LHGKWKKWFHLGNNYEKTYLDDSQGLELARAIYLVIDEERTLFSFQVQISTVAG